MTEKIALEVTSSSPMTDELIAPLIAALRTVGEAASSAGLHVRLLADEKEVES